MFFFVYVFVCVFVFVFVFFFKQKTAYEIRPRDWSSDVCSSDLLMKEVVVGLLNGAGWALVIAVTAAFWFDDIKIGLVIAAAIIINLFIAAFSGVAIPLVMRRFNIDPAIAGSVVLTTITDIVGLAAFLGLATIFLI